MSERYTRLFSLPENLYSEGAPVVVSAGALLKDNQSGKVLVQLKIKNISDKTLKAAKVKIQSFDTVGNPLEEETEYEYLDLAVNRDGEFGQKVPILLPNDSTRSFSVTPISAIFSDNEVWNYNGNEQNSLASQKKLLATLNNDVQLLNQYQLEYGSACRYSLTEDRDLWLCACGGINHRDESQCHKCGCELEKLKNADIEELEKRKAERVAKEEAQEKEDRKKLIKAIAIALPVLIVLIVSGKLYSDYSKKNTTYQTAVSYVNEEDYNNAIVVFESLGDFKDCEEQVAEAKYKRACSLLGDGSLDSAIEDFEELADYKDSKDKLMIAKQAKYQKALESYQTGNYNTAVSYFEVLEDYKDSKEMIVCAQFADKLQRSFIEADATEIEKLKDNETAKSLYETYQKYISYCGIFKCVTDGYVKDYKLKSDFFLATDGTVHWKGTEENGYSVSFLSYAPRYSADGKTIRFVNAVFFRSADETIVNDMSVSNEYSGQSNVTAKIVFTNNIIGYSGKDSKAQKTQVLKFVKADEN